MAAIQVRAIRKQFANDKIAVHDVSFDVHEGEFLAMVGPSGCGKTTTLRLLAGLESLTSGEIRFGDRVVNEIRPRDRNVAMVFQDYAVFPHLTVYENIAYGLRSRGGYTRAEIDSRVKKAAQMFRIDPLLKRKPRQLSGGERQRVALARVLLKGAPVLILDEATAHLDSATERALLTTVLDAAQGRTIILLTHSRALLDRMDSIYTLEAPPLP